MSEKKTVTKETVEITKTKKVSVKNIAKRALTGLGALAIAVIALGLLLGYKPFLVNGWSMEPIIRYQSFIVVHKEAPEDIKIGDALTFSKTGKNYTTHQLVRVEDSEGATLAEFRQKVGGEVPVEWEAGDAYTVQSPLDDDVVEWYSGIVFDEDSIFVTKSTLATASPLPLEEGTEDAGIHYIKEVIGQNEDGSDIYNNHMIGKVVYNSNFIGDLVLFIRANIILIGATIIVAVMLYNMVVNDMNKNNK